MNTSETGIDERVEELLQQLTLREKITLLSGKDMWSSMPVERLGIPSVVMTDGPHGVRSANPDTGRIISPATAFPTGISMGACWDVDLVERVAQALGEETRGMGCDILLGPCVNIVRDPRGGRNFETFSEDPHLAGRTAVAYIKGVQSRGVGTSLKHFAVNNFETERFRASVEIDERTLREIYLPQFEMAVREAQPWTVMCSYNRINGVYASENGYLLTTILRDEWGFEGAVISDWGAVHNIHEPVKNGLDLEMPGPAKFFRQLPAAVHLWQIDEADIDQAARRVLRLVVLSGRMEGSSFIGSVNTAEHQALARQLAESAITLLKNEGDVLPLDISRLRSIAVIGPNAGEAVIAGGGSSHVDPPYRISPYQAIRDALGKSLHISYAQGCDNFDEPFTIPGSWLEDGLYVAAFRRSDLSGKPVYETTIQQPAVWLNTDWSEIDPPPRGLICRGRLRVPEDGGYRFILHHGGEIRLLLDGELLMGSTDKGIEQRSEVRYLFRADRQYELGIEYLRPPDQEVFSLRLGLGRTYEDGLDQRLAQAVQAARSSDVALVFSGHPEGFESEGRDREDLDLPGGQNELISAVAVENPNTIVVLNTGAPVTMPWIDQVAAVVMAYYPGQENGAAVTNVLTGLVNPSGKLPITLPRKLEHSPAYINASYDGAREVRYGEGVFMGYRYFDQVGSEPLFPFGHGLSYTSFEYSDLQVPGVVDLDSEVRVRVTVRNTGLVPGAEAVQIYIADPVSSLPRPPKELKGFAKVDLSPGESKTINFTLGKRAFSFFHPHRMKWVAEPGQFEILAGASSRDIRLRAKLQLT